MRHLIWLLLIAFSISALAGGYLSGRAAVPRFPRRGVVAAPSPPSQMSDPLTLAPDAQTDELAGDRFSGDPAVAIDRNDGTIAQDARLAIVIVDAGHSTVLESPFVFLNVPVTFVIDPNGPAAQQMYALARKAQDDVYVQATAPVGAQQLREEYDAFPHARGIALRMRERPDTRLLHRLAALHWGVFDEYGESDAPAAACARAGIPYAARSITIDDHIQDGYVQYMLAQAVQLARGGNAVVMARPFPGTLHAFEALLARAARDGVRFIAVPTVN